jgi:hypothetical protein
VGVAVQSGLVKTLQGIGLQQDSWAFENNEQAAHWVMNAPEFALAVNLMIPANGWFEPSKDKTTAMKIGASFGIAPMDLRVGDHNLSSQITFTIAHDGEGQVTEDFVLEPIKRSVPAGLWGNEFLPGVNSEPVVKNVVTGFRLAAAAKKRPQTTSDIKRKNLAFDTDLLNNAYQWNDDWDNFIATEWVSTKSVMTDEQDMLALRDSVLASFDLPV